MEATTLQTRAYGATGSLIGGEKLKEMQVERRLPQAGEVLVEVLFCGVCHSDAHQVANDWKNTIYPCVPGHEIVGKIVALGPEVNGWQKDDLVGIGCMIDSCQSCTPCEQGDEQFCQGPVGMTMTYNGYWKPDGSGFNTYGGYSTHVVANQKFLLRIPEQLAPEAAAPILCAGVTTYTPMKEFGVQAGHRVGIVGIGGLGHMGLMLAKAMGAQVVAITSKQEKMELALEMGADEVMLADDQAALQAAEASFDFLLVTIPEPFDVNPLIPLLKWRGRLVTVGLLGPFKKPVDNMELAKLNRSMGGSVIGSVVSTQEVLDFCAEKGIAPLIELIEIQQINDAFSKIKNEEVRFRYVIDMASLKQDLPEALSAYELPVFED